MPSFGSALFGTGFAPIDIGLSSSVHYLPALQGRFLEGDRQRPHKDRVQKAGRIQGRGESRNDFPEALSRD